MNNKADYSVKVLSFEHEPVERSRQFSLGTSSSSGSAHVMKLSPIPRKRISAKKARQIMRTIKKVLGWVTE